MSAISYNIFHTKGRTWPRQVRTNSSNNDLYLVKFPLKNTTIFYFTHESTRSRHVCKDFPAPDEQYRFENGTTVWTFLQKCLRDMIQQSEAIRSTSFHLVSNQRRRQDSYYVL